MNEIDAKARTGTESKAKDPHAFRRAADPVVSRLADILGQDLIGIYALGSAVMDDWHEGKSDLDLLVLVKESLDKGRQSEVASALRDCRSAKAELLFVPMDEIAKTGNAFAVYRSGRFSDRRASNAVVWFTLKKKGLCLAGTPIGDLPLGTDEELVAKLMEYVAGNVRGYWNSWLRAASKVSIRGILALTDWGVEWCACGISRMVYTLREADVTSKGDAAAYMRQRVPQVFVAILEEALDIRLSRPRQKRFVNAFARRRALLAYLSHAIAEAISLSQLSQAS